MRLDLHKKANGQSTADKYRGDADAWYRGRAEQLERAHRAVLATLKANGGQRMTASELVRRSLDHDPAATEDAVVSVIFDDLRGSEISVASDDQVTWRADAR